MRRLARAAGIAVVELVAIAREVIVLPFRLWMRVAEVAGRWTLAVWERIWPVLQEAFRAVVAALDYLAEIFTPARAVAAVALAAAVVLGGAQYTDYRAVEVSTPQYRGVEDVAPAPQVASRDPRDQHGPTLLIVAAVALAATVLAMRGRPEIARWLLVLGGVAVVVSLAIDLPAGLDEGPAGLEYEGADAILLSGFWAQLSSGVVLALCGPLLAGYLVGTRP